MIVAKLAALAFLVHIVNIMPHDIPMPPKQVTLTIFLIGGFLSILVSLVKEVVSLFRRNFEETRNNKNSKNEDCDPS